MESATIRGLELATLKKSSWNLHEAVSYVLDGIKEPTSKNIKNFGIVLISEQSSPIYKIILESIENKELPITFKTKYIVADKKQIKEIETSVNIEQSNKCRPMSTIRNPNRCGAITSSLPSPEELKTKYKQEVYFIKPRYLVRECIKKDILINPQLNKYFNTQYWLDTKFWTFNELIILMASEEPPFPHEIVDVFRDEKYYQLAIKVRNILGKKYDIIFNKKYNTFYSITNNKAIPIIFDVDRDNIMQFYFKQISILTIIGYNDRNAPQISDQK